MASKRLALIGTQHGPWIHTAHLHHPAVRIDGAKGQCVRVSFRISTDDEVRYIDFEGDGIYPLPRTNWIRISCLTATKSLICAIISKAA
jgi:hypothetical protein